MRVLVTGGSGFLGRNLIRALKSRDHHVVNLSRKSCNLGVPEINKSVTEISRDDLLQHRIEAIFHTAARVGFTGKWSEFFNTNYLGTVRLLREGIKASIRFFVYTSSPSVVFDGDHIFGGDETLPYASKPGSFYALSKKLAEQAVLSLNQVSCVVLRPHLIFGPDDSNLLPAIIGALRSGRLFRFCECDFLADFTHIDDCVNAHLLALEYLKNNPCPQYKTFFISSGEPVGIWRFIQTVAEELDLPLREKLLSEKAILAVARLSEIKMKIFKSDIGLTRTTAEHLMRHHFFDISRAKQILGFNPNGKVLEKLKKSLSTWKD